MRTSTASCFPTCQGSHRHRQTEEGRGRDGYFADLPPGYTGGLDAAGAKSLREFVEQGGTLVALSSASEYVMDQFNVPVMNVLARVKPRSSAVPARCCGRRSPPTTR